MPNPILNNLFIKKFDFFNKSSYNDTDNCYHQEVKIMSINNLSLSKAVYVDTTEMSIGDLKIGDTDLYRKIKLQ